MSIVRIDAGTTGEARYTLRDNDGAVIPVANITALTMTLKDAKTQSVVNSRNNQDLRNGGLYDQGVTVNSQGALVWSIAAADTALVTSTAEYEEHVAEITYSTAALTGKIVHRLFCSALRNLCTFDDVKLLAPDIDDAHRLLVEKMINAVTRTFERKTGRTVKKTTGIVEVFSTRFNQWQLRVKHYPIDSITSIVEDLDGDFLTDAENKTLEAKDYAIEDNGIIRMRWRAFVEGIKCVKVTYAGGLANDVGDVPADLHEAAIEQVVSMWKRKDRLGVSSESIQGGSITVMEQDLLPIFKRVCRDYRPVFR